MVVRDSWSLLLGEPEATWKIMDEVEVSEAGVEVGIEVGQELVEVVEDVVEARRRVRAVIGIRKWREIGKRRIRGHERIIIGGIRERRKLREVWEDNRQDYKTLVRMKILLNAYYSVRAC